MKSTVVLLGIAGAALLSQPAAFSQPAPGETGEVLKAAAPGEAGPPGQPHLRAADPGETGSPTIQLTNITGEAGPDQPLKAEIGETGVLAPQLALTVPGESGPPAQAASANR